MAYQPKSYRKFVAGTVTAAVVASAVAPVSAASTFPDVPADHQFAEAINALAEKEIFKGQPDGKFNINGELSRRQAAIVFSRLIEGEGKLEKVFLDVPLTDVELTKAAYEVNAAGVMTGANGNLNPSQSLTRQQMAKLLVEHFDLESVKGSDVVVKDLDKADSSLREYVQVLAENGVTTIPNGNFNPTSTVSRGQFAAFIYRAMEVAEAGPKVESVTAVNGKVTVKFNKAPETAPVAGDFTVDRSIDGATATPASVTSFKWDAEKLTAEFAVATVAQKSTAQNVKYSVKYKDTAAKTGEFTVAALAPNLGISSTNVVDGKHIKVQFNKPVKSGTGTFEAENTGYYAVAESGNAIPVAVSKVELSEDGLTAEVTLATSLKQDTAYTVTVNKQIKDTEGKSLSTTDDYKVGVFFSDKVKPTVATVVSAGTGDVEVKFSEKLDETTKPTVVINGKSVATGNIVVDGDTVKVQKAWFDANNNDIKKGTSYPIVVAGAKDLVAGADANEMDLYSGTVVYQGVTDASAPTLTNVVVKNDHTVEVTFSEELAGLTAAQKDGATDVKALVFSSLKVLKGTTDVLSGNVTTKDGKTFKLPLNTAADVLFDSTLGETSVNVTVEAKGFKDKANNLGATAAQTVNLVKDTTKPVLVRAEYDVVNSDFVFTFDQDLDTATNPSGKVTVINKSTGAAVAGLTTADFSVTDKTVRIDRARLSAAIPAGTYTVSFAAGAVKDDSIAKNSVAAFTADVTVSDSNAGKVAPKVNTVLRGTTGDEILVTFDKSMKSDDTSASVTNVNNYKLNGAALPAGTVITYAGTTAKIQMPEGSVEISGTKVLTVSNVQDVAGNVIETVNNTVELLDTVKPKMVSAKVDSDNKIVLTFSEDIDGKADGNNGSGSELTPAAGDFLVFVNGVSVAVALEKGAEETQVKLSSSTVNFASGTIVVKTKASGITGQDEAGNKLKADDSITVTR